jgi:hypothetical protein
MRLAATLILTSLLLLPLLGLQGCTEPAPSASTSKEDQRTIKQLRDWNHRVLVASRQKDDRLRSMTRLVHKMIDDVAGVSNRQGLVRGVRVDHPVYLQSEFPQTERSIRAAERQFLMHLSVLESSLQEGERKAERLRHQQVEEPSQEVTEALAEARADLEASAEATERFAAAVDSLSALLDAREAERLAMHETVDRLHQHLADQKHAYVIAAPAEELEAKGVIDRRFLRASTIRELSPDAFSQTTTDATELSFDGRSATLLSLHRLSPDLYRMEPGRLVILDPDAFWAVSRYVILETE